MKKGIAFASLLFLPTLALAGSGLQKKMKATYPEAKNISCKTCHEGTPRLNSYGSDLAKASSDFKAVEKLDSDGDGFDNLTEITKGSNPGDKASMP